MSIGAECEELWRQKAFRAALAKHERVGAPARKKARTHKATVRIEALEDARTEQKAFREKREALNKTLRKADREARKTGTPLRFTLPPWLTKPLGNADNPAAENYRYLLKQLMTAFGFWVDPVDSKKKTRVAYHSLPPLVRPQGQRPAVIARVARKRGMTTSMVERCWKEFRAAWKPRLEADLALLDEAHLRLVKAIKRRSKADV